MQKITNKCNSCGNKFTITYYAKVEDNDLASTCNRCWNKQVSSYWTSTRDVLKTSPSTYTSSKNDYSSTLGSFLSAKKAVSKPKSASSVYFDNLIPESKLNSGKSKNKGNKNGKGRDNKQHRQLHFSSDKKVEPIAAATPAAPTVSWLANHHTGAKEPLLSGELEINVQRLMKKIKEG